MTKLGPRKSSRKVLIMLTATVSSLDIHSCVNCLHTSSGSDDLEKREII